MRAHTFFPTDRAKHDVQEVSTSSADLACYLRSSKLEKRKLWSLLQSMMSKMLAHLLLTWRVTCALPSRRRGSHGLCCCVATMKSSKCTFVLGKKLLHCHHESLPVHLLACWRYASKSSIAGPLEWEPALCILCNEIINCRWCNHVCNQIINCCSTGLTICSP